MKILLPSLTAIALAVSLAGCSTSSSGAASSLEGTWVGTNLGYEGGEFQEREIRLVIEESTGTTFAGVKSWRASGGEWSEPESFSGAILESTEFHAADSDGYLIGTVISPTSIHANYLEAGEDNGVFALDLQKVAP